MENPFHEFHVHKLRATLNITYSLFYFLALTFIFYYRSAAFFLKKATGVLFAAELVFSFLWAIKQPMYWRPITRTVFPEKLPKDEKLPGIDVLICTADPNKEPTFEVINTVISAMSLDYPAHKLSVYLSDDAGASVTLNAMKQAWVFASWWLPFCRKYHLKTICPQAYFQNPEDQEESSCQTNDMDFVQHSMLLEEKYEAFKQQVRSNKLSGDVDNNNNTSRDHPPLVQVINENCIEDGAVTLNPEAGEMPLLVYVSREKRPSHPHCFKAGALNALLRVSSIMSNSPYTLILDCDMYCNDSISARQAMCFFIDPKISSSLGWVQFPQKFHNISDTDIYDSQLRVTWPVYWPGADGLQGPCIIGTNVYIKRKVLYSINITTDDGINLKEVRSSLGPSNELTNSVVQNDKLNKTVKDKEVSSVMVQEAHFLASCTYEKGTMWGQKVGFCYGTIVEDAKTSIRLQNKGWRSIYLNPTRPQFLGSATTSLNEMLVQGIRWYGGLLDLCLSKYCPLIYRPSRMQFLQKMYYSWMVLLALDFIPVLCFAIIPPICFLYGIPVYPKLSDPGFVAFAFVFVSTQLKHLSDVVVYSGGSVSAWVNEQRTWMAKCLSCYLYGTIVCIITKLGLHEATFTLTDKLQGDTTNWYDKGIYDFRTSKMFLVPIVTAVILNLCCFIGGVARLIVIRNWDAMFGQMLFSLYVLVMGFPVLEGVLLRKDNARISVSASMVSTILSLLLLSLGYLILRH
ncbi:hypothetical protein SOVF_076670 [Spinacia oleracea]|uniref:Cellulose synthase-like protein G2 n=1 Tax=Spinacia oleracea TaxID=3562 RepID=A0ABM3REX3_SPIOL|nr:cellulose synthase-like protein G2 [Spinacia oleracea]KNA17848.1 hypothetical protein SOVF_076670 [Spinacia oleracea]